MLLWSRLVAVVEDQLYLPAQVNGLLVVCNERCSQKESDIMSGCVGIVLG